MPWGILYSRLLECMDFVALEFGLSFGVLLSESLPELN